MGETTDRTNERSDIREALHAAIAEADVALSAHRLEDAERALLRGLDLAEQLGDDAAVAAVQLRMGEVRLGKGDHGAARASAVAALEIFSRLESPLDRARGCRLLGSILRESGAADLAERRLTEAVDITRQRGASDLELDALLELVTLFRGEGRTTEAIDALVRIRGLVTELHARAGRVDDRAERAVRLFADVARDCFPAARAADLDRAYRVAQIARALAAGAGLAPAEAATLCFTTTVGTLRSGRAGSGNAADEPDPAKPVEPLPAELLSEPDGSPAGEPADLSAGIAQFAMALDGADLRSTGQELRAHVLAAARAQGHRWHPAILEAVERVDWAALVHRRDLEAEEPARGAAATTSPEDTTILVVDDDPDVRTIISDYFGAKGYRVETAETGDGLFSILGRVKPDLLLLDLMLPGRDGRTILDRIRSSLSWSHVPVIVITGVHDAAVATRTLRAGADDWVEKPLDLPTLQARVERLLSLRRALHEAEKHRSRQELLLEIIRELTGSLDTDHLLNRLVRRIAEATGVAKCSLVLTDLAKSKGTLASAYDNPTVHGLQLDLERYPEIRRALESREPVVVSDLDSDPLFAEVREKWAASVNVRSSAVIPLLVDDNPIGVFLIRTTLDEPPLDHATVEFAVQVTEAAGKALEYARLFERISSDLREAERAVNDYRSLSLTDPLTRLANRAGLESRGTDLFLSARAFDHPLSVIMLDLDNFKALNDAHGHAAGDEVLRNVGAALTEFTEPNDLVARYGGDEFCVVLPYREVDDATRIARLIGERVREIRVEWVAGASPCASMGVASFPLLGASTLNDLIALADEALYRAKEAGGGHVQVAFGGMPASASSDDPEAVPAP